MRSSEGDGMYLIEQQKQVIKTPDERKHWYRTRQKQGEQRTMMASYENAVMKPITLCANLKSQKKMRSHCPHDILVALWLF